MNASSLLEVLESSGAFTAVDRALALIIVQRANLSGDTALAVGVATALLSRAVQEGHSALAIDDLARQSAELRFEDRPVPSATPSFGNAAWWTSRLAVDGVIGTGTSAAPLILEDQLLQFRRLYDAEQRIAKRLVAMCASGKDEFQIITGGPGTGKTTRAARDLVAIADAQPMVQVALAAPTGKAAQRMSESIRARLDQLAAPDALRHMALDDAATVHRLLGYNPVTDTFRRKGASPLAADLVIIDEASMISVLLMDALLAAIGPNTRLRLVGDHHQLSSVEAGDVLGALCRAAAHDTSPLRHVISTLTQNYRFATHPAIGELANAILDGNSDRALGVLRDATATDVSWQMLDAATGRAAIVEPLQPHLDRYVGAASPSELLDVLNGFRVLAPEREGELGVKRLNTIIEEAMRARGLSVSELWYHRRPVLVTANDYVTEVYNGDIGVVWETNGTPMVHFPDGGGRTRAVPPLRLPSVETAWAMTVHKSQGSEFDDVLVVLPAKESRVLGRELLYTAVTRARHKVTILGDERVIRNGIAETKRRQSRLERLLR